MYVNVCRGAHRRLTLETRARSFANRSVARSASAHTISNDAKSIVRALKPRPNATKSWETLKHEKFAPSARKA
jgi:hypothetical protein